MSANEQDIELCELYLDRELSDAELRRVDQRLSVDVTLRGTLERLRGQRDVRLEAMSTAFDTDAASVERLAASVRTAQATELLRRKSAWWRPSRTMMAAAASIAFGVTLGGVIQGRQGGHWSSAPSGTSAPPTSIVSGNTVDFGSGLSGHGVYVVSIVDANGHERVRGTFPTAERARQFVESVNSGGAGALNAGDARVLDESY